MELDVLYNEDCLLGMQRIPDGSVDMILCDLPYAITQNCWDSVIPFEPLWEQYKRVTRKTAAIVLTAAQPFTSKLVCSNLAEFKQALVWKKNVASNFLNANRQHLMRHEDVLIFGRNQGVFNKQATPGQPYLQKRSGRDDTGTNYGSISIRTDTVNSGTRNPISILEFNREVGLHPTQKPVALFEYLIRTYTNKGETVLDSCLGSGTTAIACINTNRHYIGFEKDPGYFQIAQKRIADHKPQLSLTA
jgi:site-specific DNA-methyltransferase (adenine-specific)